MESDDMSTAVSLDVDVFDTKALAQEDAESIYGEGATIRYYGCDAQGWTWSYVPACAVDAGYSEESSVVPFPSVPVTEHTDTEGNTFFVGGSRLPISWQEMDTTADQITAEQAIDAEGYIDERLRTVDCEPGIDAYREPPAAVEPMVTVKLTATVTLAQMAALQAFLTGVEGYRLVVGAGGGWAPRQASQPSGPRAPRAVDATRCRVDGLSWPVDLIPGDGNRRAAGSMKARVDKHASAGDVLMLRTLTWAGCPGNPSVGNAYQKMGAQYLANWIAHLEAKPT